MQKQISHHPYNKLSTLKVDGKEISYNNEGYQ